LSHLRCAHHYRQRANAARQSSGSSSISVATESSGTK
jgi:hypothetical protein